MSKERFSKWCWCQGPHQAAHNSLYSTQSLHSPLLSSYRHSRDRWRLLRWLQIPGSIQASRPSPKTTESPWKPQLGYYPPARAGVGGLGRDSGRMLHSWSSMIVGADHDHGSSCPVHMDIAYCSGRTWHVTLRLSLLCSRSLHVQRCIWNTLVNLRKIEIKKKVQSL